MTVFWKLLKRFLLLGVLPLLLLGGIFAWFERDTLLTYWYLHKLENARGDEALGWAEKLARFEERIIPDVVGLLSQDDADVCANARTALVCLGNRWGHGDPRCMELMNQAIKEFHRLSPCGQTVVLRLAAEWIDSDPGCPKCLACACGRLLAEVDQLSRPEQCGLAVELAAAVLRHSNEADLHCAARELARTALQSRDGATRIRSLHLAILPGIDLRKDVVPLLNDPEAEVRRQAMLALGEADDVILTDNLLPWLHDPDPEVRRLCEQALAGKKRGLKPRYIRLAKLITDPRWDVRLGVLDHLGESRELDAGAWLRRLSHDPTRAVRAAAIRAACETPSIDLSDRIDQIARDDPSPTVSELARHYLEQRKDEMQSRGP
jgi:hypothetical protein